MSYGTRILTAMVLLLALTFAQAWGQAGSPLIHVDSNLVTVPVSVTDSFGRPVGNLRLDDFQLEEDGNLEPLTRLAEPGQTPIELALLLDLSDSVQPRFELEREAAAKFLLRVLRPGDSLTIMSIGPHPGIIQQRTTSIEEGLRSLAAIPAAAGSTAFYDAVVAGARSLAGIRIPGMRRVEVVLSDGEDTNSETWNLAGALEEVQRADCVFYSINPAGPSIRMNAVSLEGQEGMRRLAAQTGGAAFLPERIDEVAPVFDRIAAELRAQYLLEYYSSDQRRNGSFRRISVRIPSRPDLRIHARTGYYPVQG